MTNLPDIRNQIFEDGITKRIVIKMKNENLDSQDYRTSATKIVSEVFPEWESDPRILFLAIDVCSERTFIVLDINHHEYDFNTAHKAKTVFPAFVLRQHKRRRDWVIFRWPQGDEYLSAHSADVHNVNGFDPPPFLEDHKSHLEHVNPRDLLT
ncbi:unnamed protein product [Penicillium salamii]|uniref:Uncharacterized protein n=1 Tax=Penicillium salamii TaxID=1612424 RepID=A0A9W4IVP8_9EURO|nr:unnamed protein product [Penicillium salamii]